ncbi:hypothetical protein [Photobacterium minamisatsumaniensis]|uniref:hypothetical protein n=1 Tax=Photobacterium minamisatsumaniensis TaxID=2910233 RepID=UPI003D127A0B
MGKAKNFLLFFFWMFPITFTFFPVGSGKIVSVYFILYLVSNLDLNLKSMLNKAVYALVTLMLYFTLLTLINNINDLTLPYLLLLHIVEFIPGAVYFSYLLQKREICDETIALYLMFAGLILSISVFLLLASHQLRILSDTFIPSYGNIDAMRVSRIRGLSNGGGADHSVQLAITSIGALYLFNKAKSSASKLLYLVCAIITIGAVSFVARTGLLIVILFLFVSIVIFNKEKIKGSILVIFSFLVILLSMPFIIPLLDNMTGGSFSSNTLPWISDLFSVITEGRINQSNSHLLEMLFLPDTLTTFLFGQGSYSDFGLYQYSDSGYVKFIFSFGVFITFLFVFFILSLCFKGFTSRSELDKLLSIFIMIMLVMTIKEPFLIKIGTVHILYLLLFKLHVSTKAINE